VLFVHADVLSFRNIGNICKRFCQDRADIDAVHIDLTRPFWMKVLGKQFPIPGGWDFHRYRYMRMWGHIIHRWFRDRLPLDRFDVVHLMPQGIALSMLKASASPSPRFVINLDATAWDEVNEFGFSPFAHRAIITAERKMFAAADLIVTENRWVTRSLRDHYHVDEGRIHVAHNSLEVPARSRWDPDARADGELTKIVFVGSGWKRKGGDLLLTTHQQRFADRAELHILGSHLPVVRSARNVVWHGLVPRDRLIHELLPTMDIFVLASRIDMLPWALLEAAAIGLPIVAPRVGGIPDVVIDDETGHLFAPGDARGLAAALDRQIADPALRERMGRAARKFVAQHHDPNQTYPELINRLVELADTDPQHCVEAPRAL